MNERLKRAKRLLLASALSLGLGTACDTPFNRTHLGIQRDPGDYTLLAKSPSMEIYAFCGPNIKFEDVRRPVTYPGEGGAGSISHLQNDRGFAQIIKRALSRGQLTEVNVSQTSNGIHEIYGEVREFDSQGNSKVTETIRATLAC